MHIKSVSCVNISTYSIQFSQILNCGVTLYNYSHFNVCMTDINCWISSVFLGFSVTQLSPRGGTENRQPLSVCCRVWNSVYVSCTVRECSVGLQDVMWCMWNWLSVFSFRVSVSCVTWCNHCGLIRRSLHHWWWMCEMVWDQAALSGILRTVCPGILNVHRCFCPGTGLHVFWHQDGIGNFYDVLTLCVTVSLLS